MEAQAVPVEMQQTPLERARDWANANPARVALGVLVTIFVVLVVAEGLQRTAQVSINGLVSGSYFALGAVGLTLVYGILKLVNFAHGDMLTFGAYVAFLFNVTIGMPLAAALVIAILVTAALGVATELVMWRPMRNKNAGLVQLLLMTIGLAFLLRNSIQFIAGTQPKQLNANLIDSVSFLGLRIGRTELIVLVVGVAVLIAVGLMLRYTRIGKQMRALSDNFDLAETTGINTNRVVIFTWILSAGLAGLAGVLVTASTGALTPNTGFFLLLALFASVVLGGIGNAYGALAGGIVLGLSQEWSTLLLDARWKAAVSFGVLILVLIIRPQGIFGQERAL